LSAFPILLVLAALRDSRLRGRTDLFLPPH
jgi:hypothetical protein